MTTRVLSFLGVFQVRRDGAAVTRFHSDKVRALLAYLATEADRPHARTTLASLLWPDQEEAPALRNLSQSLVRLREALGHSDASPAPLRATLQSIQWLPDAADVDVTAFARLARSADPGDLARAAALYGGEFLAGFALPGCEAFEEWLLLTREHLQQAALAALHALAEHHLQAQRWAEAAAAAQRQIELERWRESAYYQLMRALAGAGRRAEALAAYQRCALALRDNLGIAPDQATVALADAIRAGESQGENKGAPTGASALRLTLPSPLAALVGRENELARVGALLQGDGARLVTIGGVGGAGKTRLALAAAWSLREAFADNVAWVPLAGVAPTADPAMQPDALAVAVGAALGLAFDGRAAPLDELRRVLQGRPTLLVLDNCEHLPVAAFVHELLVAVPQLRVLATSRARLAVVGEATVRLEGLPVPAQGAGDPARYAGVQLFLAQARRHAPDLGDTSASLAAAARLCRLLDGLPLGIELAARWVGHYTCDEIAAHIQADLDFLAAERGGAPERHHSMRAALDYSLTMLRDPERQALARLSVFRGTFDRAAAEAVAGTRVATLAALVDASLLRNLGVGRYGFHELVRQFAAARLAELGQGEELAARHAAFYLELLARQEAALYGDAPQRGASVIRDAADNVQQAWAWSIERGAWGGIARSLPALRQYVQIDGLFYEHASRVAAAAAQLGAQLAAGEAGAGHTALLGRLRGTEAYFLERQEARAAAAAAAREAIANAAAAGDALGEAYGLLQLSAAAVPYIASLAPQEALPAAGWLERAIALCRSVGEAPAAERRFATEAEAACLLKLCTIRIELREYAAACALAEQALALARQNGDRMQQARALSVSAMALENAGRFEAAFERRVAMLDMARANGSRPQEQLAHNNLSCTLIYLGDYAAALDHARAALRFLGEWLQNPYESADYCHTLSWAACRAGEAEEAGEAARRALAFAQATGIPQHQTLPLLALGDAQHDLGRYGEALEAYAAALALGRAHALPSVVTVALAGIARCRLADGAPAEALTVVDELLRGPDILTLGSLWEPGRVAETCCRVLAANGDPRAAGLLSAAAALLDRQASAIADGGRRRAFREQVAAHRAIGEALAREAPHAVIDTASAPLVVAAAPQPLGRDDMPPLASIYGRRDDLARLERWLAHDRCRLVAVLGIGGVGKTTLAAAAARAAAPQFDVVVWRSLLNAPPPDELLRDLLQRLASRHLVDMPSGLDAQLALLTHLLRQRRCLLVLDNLESIMRPDQPGQMRPGYDAYALLLQCVAEREHSSCLLLTSRERPQGLARREEDAPLVRTLSLPGLDAGAGQAMLAARGLSVAAPDAAALVGRYSGNPLALRLVAQTVQDLFGGDIAAFLAAEAPIFDDIRAVLDQQFARLSPLEQELLTWLAVEREPIAIQALRDNLAQPPTARAVLEAVSALQRRSLLATSAQGVALQNVVAEYLTDVLVGQVCREVEQSQVAGALNRYALLKATSKDYVRASQARLIVEPVASQLLARLGRAGLIGRLSELLASLRAQSAPPPGYAAGAILNLLLHLRADLRGYDFSRLSVWQASLQGALLPEVSFREANLSRSVFTHIFGEILAIRFDGEQQLQVAGANEGRLCLWRAADGQLLNEFYTISAGATIAAFSADGHIIATGDTDHRVRLWDVARGQLLHALSGHTETPWGLMFSPDGATLASSGADGAVNVWDVRTGRLRQTLRGHTSAVPALAFTGDGQTLASGDIGGAICVWRLGAPEPLHTLCGHAAEVHALAFDASGALLASGSHDRTVGVWDVASGRLAHTLSAHTDVIRALALSPDGRTLASGGGDTFVCLWDVRTGAALHTLLGLTHRNAFLAFSAHGQTLATVGSDQTVCLWEVSSGQRVDVLQAHSDMVYAVDFSPDGRALVSGGADGIGHLWDLRPGAALARLLVGHASGLYAVAFSPDGARVASGSRDRTIRLWDVRTAQLLRTLYGHTDDVEALQFSPDGRHLLSASRDATLRVWDVESGLATHTLHGHTERVLSCAFSHDGHVIASGGIDCTARLWDLRAPAGGELTRTLAGHTNAVRCVAFDGDGSTLATSSFDQTVLLWDTQSGQVLHAFPTQNTITTSVAFQPGGALLATGAKDYAVRLWAIGQAGEPEAGSAPRPTLLAVLRGHTNSVEAVRFSPDGGRLASGSTDGTVRVWEVATRVCLQTLQAEGPYKGMNIAGATGISHAQRAALRALGALEAGQ